MTDRQRIVLAGEGDQSVSMSSLRARESPTLALFPFSSTSPTSPLVTLSSTSNYNDMTPLSAQGTIF